MEGWATGAAIFIFALLWAQIFMDYRKKLMRIVPGVREVATKKAEFSTQIVDAESQSKDFVESLESMRQEVDKLEEERQELQERLNPVEMVRIPAGKLKMGTNLANHEDENPEHGVGLMSYYIDPYEVTNLQYKDFVDGTGHRQPAHWINGTFPNPNHADHPVTNVSWEDAKAYAKWVGKRLPTEAEWERAAKGDSSSDYPWRKSAVAQDRANFENPTGGTSSVSRYPDSASEFGVWDLCGNVGEWVNDWYDPRFYQSSPDTDPTGPDEGRQRVYRGGGYHCNKMDIRASARHPANPASYFDYIGFRCAMDVEEG